MNKKETNGNTRKNKSSINIDIILCSKIFWIHSNNLPSKTQRSQYCRRKKYKGTNSILITSIKQPIYRSEQQRQHSTYTYSYFIIASFTKSNTKGTFKRNGTLQRGKKKSPSKALKKRQMSYPRESKR